LKNATLHGLMMDHNEGWDRDQREGAHKIRDTPFTDDLNAIVSGWQTAVTKAERYLPAALARASTFCAPRKIGVSTILPSSANTPTPFC
jgi:hypothetical protein